MSPSFRPIRAAVPCPPSRIASLAVLAMTLLVVGCGYTTKEIYPSNVRTVAVKIFENRSFYQGLEFDASEALIKEIERRTPYKVVSSGAADTVLDVSITSVDQTRLSRRLESGVAQEMELRITVNFQWKNARTGNALRDRKGFVAVGRYIPTRAPGEATFGGETIMVGRHEAAQALATAIVSEMRGDW